MRECLITSCLGTYKFIRAVLNRFQDVRDQKEILKMLKSWKRGRCCKSCLHVAAAGESLSKFESQTKVVLI